MTLCCLECMGLLTYDHFFPAIHGPSGLQSTPLMTFATRATCRITVFIRTKTRSPGKTDERWHRHDFFLSVNYVIGDCVSAMQDNIEDIQEQIEKLLFFLLYLNWIHFRNLLGYARPEHNVETCIFLIHFCKKRVKIKIKQPVDFNSPPTTFFLPSLFFTPCFFSYFLQAALKKTQTEAVVIFPCHLLSLGFHGDLLMTSRSRSGPCKGVLHALSHVYSVLDRALFLSPGFAPNINNVTWFSLG